MKREQFPSLLVFSIISFPTSIHFFFNQMISSLVHTEIPLYVSQFELFLQGKDLLQPNGIPRMWLGWVGTCWKQLIPQPSGNKSLWREKFQIYLRNFFPHWEDMCNVFVRRTLQHFSLMRFVDNIAYAGLNNRHKDAIAQRNAAIHYLILSFFQRRKNYLTDTPIQHSLKRNNSSARPFLSLRTKPKKENSCINFSSFFDS